MNKLIVKNKKKRILNTLEEWEKGFIEVDEKNHWSEGYSAFSLGKFFTCELGEKWLNSLMTDVFGEEVVYDDAEIEHASKLDTYGKRQRMQDLAIWGTVLGENIFVAIEAKVLESFGNYYVKEEYDRAIQERDTINPRSKKTNRIEDIVEFLFPGKTPYDEPVCNLRYQLMHYFTASIKEGKTLKESNLPLKKRKTSISTVVLPVLVFKTNHYYEDPETGNSNKKDYVDFVTQLGFNTKNVGNRTIYYKNIHNCNVYTAYEAVELL